MISISSEAVNLRSPYKVRQEDDSVFRFQTKHGIVYSVGFVLDTSFLDEGVYQFFIINESGRTARKDEDLLKTVRVVIEEFFAQAENVMLYICDTTDKRQASRDRLFRMWFHTYMLNDTYTMYNEQMIIDNVRYYTSVILRKDHPLHNKVIGSFHDFILENNQA